MGKLNDIVMAVIIIGTGAGFVLVNDLFTSLLSMVEVGTFLPSYATFENAGFLIIALGVLYLVSAFISKNNNYDKGEHVCTYCGEKLQGEKELKEHIERFHRGKRNNMRDFQRDYSDNYEEEGGEDFEEREEEY